MKLGIFESDCLHHHRPLRYFALGNAPGACANLKPKIMKVQVNAEGKLRIVVDGKKPLRLYAEVAQLQADANWRERVEFREGEFGPFAVLVESQYSDLDV